MRNGISTAAAATIPGRSPRMAGRPSRPRLTTTSPLSDQAPAGKAAGVGRRTLTAIPMAVVQVSRRNRDYPLAMAPSDPPRRVGTLHGGWHDNEETLALLAVA